MRVCLLERFGFLILHAEHGFKNIIKFMSVLMALNNARVQAVRERKGK